MNKAYNAVKDFHESFGHPVAQIPKEMEYSRRVERFKWITEEAIEFLEADAITDQADAIIDLIYFALGTMVEMGIEPEELFYVVQNANMAKLWEDGKPHYREDGKIIKPEGWEPPENMLSVLIANQGLNAIDGDAEDDK